MIENVNFTLFLSENNVSYEDGSSPLRPWGEAIQACNKGGASEDLLGG